MPSIDTLPAFLGISILLTLAPGPDNLMVLGLSLSRGRRAGLAFAVGCALGCFTHTLWAALGVSALLHTAPALFTALKFAGAAYLLWLGLQALRASAAGRSAEAALPAAPARTYLWRGLLANAINPKVALFFLAFLPQFIGEGGAPAMLLLGGVFALQTTLVFGCIAWSAGSFGRLLQRHPRAGTWLDRLSGVLFIGLALRLASEHRPM